MKKYFVFLGLLCTLMCSAQITTTSNYDTDGDGNVNIADVTAGVNNLLGKAADSHNVVDAAVLNDLLKSINDKLESLQTQNAKLDLRLKEIEKKLGIETDDDDDPEYVDTHEYVDLGLSVMWATCNLGAESPEGNGSYFAWGEKEAKTSYTWTNYSLCNGNDASLKKYCTSSTLGTCDNKTVLESADDAATALWGRNWRMPTSEEMAELHDNCSWEYTTVSGVNGYKVSAKADATKFIFLPVGGSYDKGTLYDKEDAGNYWTSTLSKNSKNACYLMFDEDGVDDEATCARSYGMNIRAVRKAK